LSTCHRLQHVVEWDLIVYEVELKDPGRYRLTSQPIPLQNPEALPLVHVISNISPRGEGDERFLHRVRTDDPVKIRGVVKQVIWRSAIVIEPAMLVLPVTAVQR
jgi:hypothetical protein